MKQGLNTEYYRHADQLREQEPSVSVFRPCFIGGYFHCDANYSPILWLTSASGLRPASSTVDRFNAGYVQQIAIDRVSGKALAGLRQPDDYLTLRDKYHFRPANLVRCSVGKAYSEWLKRMTEEVLLDRFRSHYDCHASEKGAVEQFFIVLYQ